MRRGANTSTALLKQSKPNSRERPRITGVGTDGAGAASAASTWGSLNSGVSVNHVPGLYPQRRVTNGCRLRGLRPLRRHPALTVLSRAAEVELASRGEPSTLSDLPGAATWDVMCHFRRAQGLESEVTELGPFPFPCCPQATAKLGCPIPRHALRFLFGEWWEGEAHGTAWILCPKTHSSSD